MIVIVILCAQIWSSPVNIGIPGIDDLMHQADRQYHPSCAHPSCLVWQVNLNGNWDIVSRFSVDNWGGPYWDDTIRITTSNASDINPAAATDYYYPTGDYWCVWQNDSIGNWDIYVASKETSSSNWEAPYQLTADPVNEEYPSICVIHDTVWVVWQAPCNGAMNILSSSYDGVSWSLVDTVTHDFVHDNIHPKIGQRHDHALVVWEKKEDIYYAEYINGCWQIPQSICSHPADDNSPEIAVSYNSPYGTWITWQSNRDGHYEIYRTGYDSLDFCHRLTFGDAPTAPCLGFSISPSPLYFVYNGPWSRYFGANVAFSTNKAGNYDIHTSIGLYPSDVIYYVDPHPSEDIEPILCGDGEWAWVIWRTNRNGDWDLYGSYLKVDAVEENQHSISARSRTITAIPNPFNGKTEIRCAMQYSGSRQEHHHSGLSIRIFDNNGILVKNLELPSYGSSAPMAIWYGDDNSRRQLPAGVYFLVYGRNDAASITKIIKAR